jgi:hypothetical protein
VKSPRKLTDGRPGLRVLRPLWVAFILTPVAKPVCQGADLGPAVLQTVYVTSNPQIAKTIDLTHVSSVPSPPPSEIVMPHVGWAKAIGKPASDDSIPLQISLVSPTGNREGGVLKVTVRNKGSNTITLPVSGQTEAMQASADALPGFLFSAYVLADDGKKELVNRALVSTYGSPRFKSSTVSLASNEEVVLLLPFVTKTFLEPVLKGQTALGLKVSMTYFQDTKRIDYQHAKRSYSDTLKLSEKEILNLLQAK